MKHYYITAFDKNTEELVDDFLVTNFIEQIESIAEIDNRIGEIELNECQIQQIGELLNIKINPNLDYYIGEVI